MDTVHPRPKFLKALELELNVQSDGRSDTPSRVLTAMSKAVVNGIATNLQPENLSQLMFAAGKHPVTAVIATSIGLIAAAHTSKNYKNYLTDNDGLPFALTLLAEADESGLRDLNLTVTGGLYRLLKEWILPTFLERAEALEKLKAEMDDSDIAERFETYTGGLEDGEELLKIISEHLQELERQKDIEHEKNEENYQQLRNEIAQKRGSLDTRYKAGLVTSADYKMLLLELKASEVAIGAKSLGNSLVKHAKNEELTSGGNERTARHYCYLLLGIDTENKQDNSKGRGVPGWAWGLGAIMLLIVLANVIS